MAGWQPASFVAEGGEQATGPAPAGTDIDAIVEAAAQKHGVDPKLVRAVITHESNFDPNARSQTGATGLMQLTRTTARHLGLKVDSKVDERLDPAKNVDAGTRYLATQLQDFDGNIELALAAYNRGPGAVRRAGGIPAANRLNDTPKYVENILADYQGSGQSDVQAQPAVAQGAEASSGWVPSSFRPGSPTQIPARMGAGEAGLRGGAQGVSFGFADELTGAGAAGLAKLQGDERSFGDIYTQERDQSREAYRQAEEQHPGAYWTGNIGGALATAPFLVGKAAQGLSLGQKLLAAAKVGMAYGAVGGLGASEGDTAGELVADTAKGAGIGALTGGALTGAGAAVGAAGRAVGRTAIGQAVGRASRDLDWARMGGERVARKLANGFDEVIDFARSAGVIPDALEWGFRGKIAKNVENVLVREGQALEQTRAGLRGIAVTGRTARNFLLRVRDAVDKIKRIPDLKEGPQVTVGRRIRLGGKNTVTATSANEAEIAGEAIGTRTNVGGATQKGQRVRIGARASKMGRVENVAQRTAEDMTTVNIREQAHEAEKVHRLIRASIQRTIRDAGEFGAEQIYYVKKMLQDGKLYNTQGELVPLKAAGKKVMWAWLHELKQLERTFITDTLGPQGKALQETLNAANHRYSLAADLSKLDKLIPDRRGQWWQRIWKAQLPGTIIGAAGGGIPGYVAATVAPPVLKGALTRAPAVGRAAGAAMTAMAPAAKALTARYAGEAMTQE